MKGKYPEIESKMDKALAFLLEEFATIRVGRANASVLDKITVDYYGVMTPVAQISATSTPDPKTLMVQPWDTSLLKAIEKAILASDLGINPQNDGKSIRLNFPPLTEDRRKELTKTVAKKAEEAKVVIRSIRRDAVEKFKEQKKKSEVTEDDLKIMEKDSQEMTDSKIKEIDAMTEKKDKEIMEM